MIGSKEKRCAANREDWPVLPQKEFRRTMPSPLK